MPSELNELVDFIGHPNPQIRQVAVVNLIPYSTSNPEIFKTDGLKPVKRLKLLIRDVPSISQHAANILVNLSANRAVVDALIGRNDEDKDDKKYVDSTNNSNNNNNNNAFLDAVLARVILPSDPGADFLCMLLANLAKSPALAATICSRTQPPPPPKVSSDPEVLGQLVDIFVNGGDRMYNKHANYDHLAYLFADLSTHAPVRAFLTSPRPHDGVIPLAKLKIFTSHPSTVRRAGVASTIKNCAFDVECHPSFLSDDDDDGSAAVNVLPYVLLPLAGPEEFDEEDAMDMLPDLQLLPPDKQRDPDPGVLRTHVETLLLLASTRPGRERMREVKVYPLIREAHAKVVDDKVRDACEQLVQLLMMDEEDEKTEVAELKDDEDMLVEV